MQKISTNVIFAIVVLIALLGGSFFLGVFYEKANETQVSGNFVKDIQGNDIPDVDLEPLWDAWKIIDEKYVFEDKPNNQERLWGAIQGLVGSLDDPYSVFLPPRDAEIFEEDISGNFGGVGMEIIKRDDLLTVVTPLEGTPAKKAGILPGDIIIAIDGESTVTLSLEEAVLLIRGEQGTEVELSVIREETLADGTTVGSNLEFVVVRDRISIPTLDTKIREDVFIIELYNFSSNSAQLFREALREFINSGLSKMVIDLRGNPGGFLDSPIDMASWFLPIGKVIVEEDFGENDKSKLHRSRGYNIFNENLKLVILIDRGSASASEILAGALSDHGIATLVGDKSFGKGSVQELISLTNDTYLKITVAKWLTPNGISISEGGLTPKYLVEMTNEDIENGRDPQLNKAIEILR